MAKRISTRTGFLFATPSALHGAARAFDAWGVYDEYNMGDTLEHGVALGFVQDWLSLEDDARAAFSSRHVAIGT